MTPLDPTHLILASILGLLAGTLGGIAGLGGSMIMIPGLGLLFGFTTTNRDEQHLYMAAAMIANVVVAIPATLRHRRAGSVRLDLVRILLPAMVIANIAGVLLSNLLPGKHLKYLLAAFVAVYCITNLRAALWPKPQTTDAPERSTPARTTTIGSIGGLIGGFLGVGGGVVLVPLMQLWSRVPLRQAIGTSSAAMIASALLGAILKTSTLSTHQQSAMSAGALALAMAPGAVAGAYLGASLAHRLPLRAVRVIISLALLAAVSRLVMA